MEYKTYRYITVQLISVKNIYFIIIKYESMLRKRKVHCKVLESRGSIRKHKNEYKTLEILKHFYINFKSVEILKLMLMKAVLLLRARFFVTLDIRSKVSLLVSELNVVRLLC